MSMSEKSKYGTLFLIPVSIEGEKDNLADSFPLLNIEIIKSLDYFIVENERTARRFIKNAGFKRNIRDVVFIPLDKHNHYTENEDFILILKRGNNVGLLSEAGIPCVADPGNKIVFAAHENSIKVRPLTGPSSIFLALMASGLNGQNFAFYGYLPIDRQMRIAWLNNAIKDINKTGQTKIFIETPYRNLSLYKDLLSLRAKNIMLSIASHIGSSDEFIHTNFLHKWPSNLNVIHKRPAVFLLGKSNLI